MIKTVSVIHHYWPLALFINMNQHESTFPKEENIRCIRPILCVAVVGQSLYCSKPLPGSFGAPNTCSLEMFWPQRCEPRCRERWAFWLGDENGITMGNGDLTKKNIGIHGNMNGILVACEWDMKCGMQVSFMHTPCEWIALRQNLQEAIVKF